MKKKISIAMTTYNGSKYITKQLLSILSQTQKPYEVIISDDASTDKTTDLIEEFIEKHKLTNWFLYKSLENRGWRQNFYYAISLTRGDIVFFADQDDIWHHEKIEEMSKLMVQHSMGGLYTERRIINERDEIFKKRTEKSIFSGELKRLPFRNSFYSQKTLGCCMCVSRQIIDVYLKMACPECGHDSQCGRLALLYSSLWYLDKPLIDYRIHQENSSGITEIGTFGQSSLSTRVKNLEKDIHWVETLIGDVHLDENRKKILEQCKVVMENRYRYLKSGTNVDFIMLLKYIDYYSGINELIGDFAYKNNINKRLGKIRWNIHKILDQFKLKLCS